MEGASNGGNFHNIIYKRQRAIGEVNMKTLNFQILKLLEFKRRRSYVRATIDVNF